jgi:ArsR family transcriptional regulator
MQIRNYELLERQADLCQMMANPKRLAILEALDREEVCVSELAELIDTSISATSQHLRVMKDQKIVTTRKDGQTVYYRLKNPKIVEGCKLIRQVLLEELESQGRLAQDFEKENGKDRG